MNPIAYIESCYKTKFGTPRQPHLAPASQAVLRLISQPYLQGSFAGLEEFSHIWLIFLFHLNTNKTVRAKVHPPRFHGKKVGLFATRTPHRPNPIGLSLVKLERVVGSSLYLSGVDLVEGTPIFDIKPYLPEADSVTNARSGWVDSAEQVKLKICYLPETYDELQKADQRFPNFAHLLEQTLQSDPRPNVYRQDNEADPRYEDTHAVYLYDYDIHFRIKDGTAEVLKIIPL